MVDVMSLLSTDLLNVIIICSPFQRALIMVAQQNMLLL